MTTMENRFRYDLFEKVAVVTGGAQGIGEHICSDLIVEGATVIVADINKKEGERTAKILGDNAHFFEMNVTDEESVDNVLEEVIKTFGRIDILVNNAGVSRRSKLVNIETAEWQKIFDVNCNGPFYTCRSVIPHMMENGGGKIVNVSALVGRSPVPTFSAYCASKAALTAMTESIGQEYAEHKININAVCPGAVPTSMWSDSTLNTKDLSVCSSFDDIVQMFPASKMGSTEDVAHLVTYLCSFAAKSMVGQAFNITF